MNSTLDDTVGRFHDAINPLLKRLHEEAAANLQRAEDRASTLKLRNDELEGELVEAQRWAVVLESATDKHCTYVERQQSTTAALLQKVTQNDMRRRTLSRWVSYFTRRKRHNIAVPRLIVSTGLHIAKRIFYNWRLFCAEKIAQRRITKLDQASHERHRLLVDSSAAERQELKSEILRLTQQLNEEATNRDRYRDSIRAAVLRGVCALNNEAIGILGAAPPLPPSDGREVPAETSPLRVGSRHQSPQKQLAATNHSATRKQASAPRVSLRPSSARGAPTTAPLKKATPGVLMNPSYPPKGAHM